MLVQTLSVFLFLASCAKETSEEERKREQTDRERSRLQKGTGFYRGFAKIDDTKIVPVSLELTVNSNPQDGNANPALAAAVRIGMFGGVLLSSDQSSYDAGNGRISINLSKKAGGPPGAQGESPASPPTNAPFELHGTILDGKFVEGSLDGPNSGSHALTLSQEGPDLFTDRSMFNYAAQISESPAQGSLTSNAQFSLKKSTSPRPGPSTSDLPQLPGLEATLRFNNFAIVPHQALDVIYEPLAGFMDLQFSPTMTIRVENLFLTRDVLSANLADWKPSQEISGKVIQGSAVTGHMRLGNSFPGLGLENPENLIDNPPQHYVGSYTGISSPLSYRAIAALEYQFTQGRNSAEYPFLVFPVFRLKVKVCSGSNDIREGNFILSALDQIRGIARFIDSNSSQNSILDISYFDNWNTLTGKYSKGAAGPLDTTNPQLRLTASAKPITTCAENL